MSGEQQMGEKKGEAIPAFKIGTRNQGSPYVGPARREKPAETTAGFPLIEAMVEKGDFEAFNQRYRQSCQRLEKIAESDQDPARSDNARKVLRAFDRAVNLLEELMAIKEKMLAGDEEEAEE